MSFRAFCGVVLLLCVCLFALQIQAQDHVHLSGTLHRFAPESAIKLYDDVSALRHGRHDPQNPGNLIASQLPAMVSVVNGTFTTRIDFGATAFNTTAARYLEIQVGSTILTPRQAINSAPFSIRATRAASADALSAVCVLRVTNGQIATGITGSKIIGSLPNADNSTNAGTADNALNLGNVAADQFVQITDTSLTNPRPPTSDSGFYIRNGTSQQPETNFNIDGKGALGSLGIGTTTQTSGNIAFGGGAARTLIVEHNPASNSNGNSLSVTSSGATDKSGGELQISGGNGTGLGGGGNVIIRTAGAGAVSGTADNTYVDGVIYVAKAKPMPLTGNYVFTRLFSTRLTATNVTAGRV